MNNGNGNDALRRRILLAGAIGNFVEWYDFVLYGYFATTIAHLFFPKQDPTAALLSTFAIFAVGFVARPLGGIAFGHLGDRLGRRMSLIVSVVLMSSATVLMGLLPGYAQIGVAAPVLLLLCRLVQGFSAGGEMTGASIFLGEHAPAGKRARYASISSASVWFGIAFAVFVSVSMASMTTEQQLSSWGWRVPFLLAAPLAAIGLYLRLRTADSPVFAALQDKGQVESAPLAQAFRIAKKPMLVLVGWLMAHAVSTYLGVTFLVSYLTTNQNFSRTQSLTVQLVFALAAAAFNILAGVVIDRVGRKRTIAVTVMFCMGAWAIPAFALFQHSSMAGACLIVAVFALLLGFTGSITQLVVVDLFPARVRSSASGLSYNIGQTLFGGTAPYVATWLVGDGYLLGPGFYLAGLCVIAALAAALGIDNRAQVPVGHDVSHAPAEDPDPQGANA